MPNRLKKIVTNITNFLGNCVVPNFVEVQEPDERERERERERESTEQDYQKVMILLRTFLARRQQRWQIHRCFPRGLKPKFCVKN